MEKERDSSPTKEISSESTREHLEDTGPKSWDLVDHGDTSQGQVDWTKKQIAAVFCLSMLWVGKRSEYFELITKRLSTDILARLTDSTLLHRWQLSIHD